MNLFRTLAELIRPKPLPTDSQGRPFAGPLHDLTESQVKALRDLRTEWTVYLEALDRQTTLYGEAMLTAREPLDMARAQGVIQGLREAALFVERVILDDEERKNADERRRSNAEQSDQYRRSLHFGSPAWSVEQRTKSRAG